MSRIHVYMYNRYTMVARDLSFENHALSLRLHPRVVPQGSSMEFYGETCHAP